MTATLLNGKALSEKIKSQVRESIQAKMALGLRPPCLAVIWVGDNPASQAYVHHKQKACERVGVVSQLFHLPASTSETTLLSLLQTLNENPSIDAILVQLPLPKHMDPEHVIEKVAFDKDVDGFHPYNMGRLALRNPLIRPCTPKGIMALLDELDTDLKGMHAVIVGASNIVGRPMGLELLLAGCTVTICHRFTKNLKQFTQQADLLVAAVGKPAFIGASDLKDGVIAIDVGITRDPNGQLRGDLDFDGILPKARALTPVPGGVGPMTVAMLLENTLSLYESHLKKDKQR